MALKSGCRFDLESWFGIWVALDANFLCKYGKEKLSDTQDQMRSLPQEANRPDLGEVHIPHGKYTSGHLDITKMYLPGIFSLSLSLLCV